LTISVLVVILISMETHTNRWTKSKTAIYNLGYHLIWCTKYRRKLLTNGIDLRLKELLVYKANALDCNIESMEIMPEHVHIFIKASPVHAPQFIVGQLKGYTSFNLRNEFPKLKTRVPSVWTRSYYAESVGHISSETIKRYIMDQKKK